MHFGLFNATIQRTLRFRQDKHALEARLIDLRSPAGADLLVVDVSMGTS